jgi:uncharacterized RDD family membrane protein YckC
METHLDRTGLSMSRASQHGSTPIYTSREVAPFSLRCGALLIDYIVIVGVIAVSTVLARMMGGGARVAGSTLETIGILVGILVLLANFVALPALVGQTVGKWAAGLHIERTDGSTIDFGRALLRHLVGYTASTLTMGVGFLIAIFNARGRALHDLIAGTVVVRERSRTQRKIRQ